MANLGSIPVLGGAAKVGLTALNLLPGAPGTALSNLVLGTNYNPGDMTPGYSAANVVKTQAGNIFGGSQPAQNTNNAAPGAQQQPGNGATGVLGDSTVASTGGSSTVNPQYAAYYQDTINQLQPQLGQLDNQQAIGMQNILNSYNLAQNRANQQQAADQRNYQTQLGQNQQSYANNRNAILQNTMMQNNALQRLLGLAGSGNSSASYEQAPYAAALQGSQQLYGAQNTFGQNQQSLNTNWQDYMRNFGNSMADLDTQKFQQQQNLQSSIAQTRANLLNQIAQANVYKQVAQGQDYNTALAARQPFQSQINDLLGQITQLGNQWQNPQMATGPVTYAAPALNDFTLSQGPAATSTADASGDNGTVLPTFLNILQPKRDQSGQLVAQ